MTLHCARCRKTLVSGPIIVAILRKVEFCEQSESLTAPDKKPVMAYYCEECMRCVH